MMRCRIITRGRGMLALAAGCLAGCHGVADGPRLTLQSVAGATDEHALFVDGAKKEGAGPDRWLADGPIPPQTYSLPFRYYGTTRWDALPVVPVENGVPRFDREPASAEVVVEPPASPWLFPLDFPIEVFDRLVNGRRDLTVPIDVPPKSQEEQDWRQIPREALSEMTARARAARVAR
ncbi:MAG: hypothetical protein AB8H80_12235 [Planctomycetota bacterium]